MTMRPRILICEFNNAVPSELALTIPYQAQISIVCCAAARSGVVPLGQPCGLCRRRKAQGISPCRDQRARLQCHFPARRRALLAEMPEIPASTLDANWATGETRRPMVAEVGASAVAGGAGRWQLSEVSMSRIRVDGFHSHWIWRLRSWCAFRAFVGRNICGGRYSRSRPRSPAAASPVVVVEQRCRWTRKRAGRC